MSDIGERVKKIVVEHLGVGVKTIDWTHDHAIGIAALFTIVGYSIGHCASPFPQPRATSAIPSVILGFASRVK